MTTWDTASSRNRRDPLWRARHGFANIDPAPKGWPVLYPPPSDEVRYVEVRP